MTQAFAPLLGADPARTEAPGRIVMISSVGSRNALPFGGPYAASKFALEGLSESLRRELILFGIDVIIVAPGSVVTPIWDKAETMDVTPFASTPYAAALKTMRSYMLAHGRKGLAPERIAGVVRTALTTARPKTRYTVAPNALQTLMTAALPKRFVGGVAAFRTGLVVDTTEGKDVALLTRMRPARHHCDREYADRLCRLRQPRQRPLDSKIGLEATNKWPGETSREWGSQIRMA